MLDPPLTPPAAIRLRYANSNAEAHLLTNFIRGRKLPPSPEREAAALLNMRRDLLAGNAIDEADLGDLDTEKRDELRVIGWAFNWDFPDDYYAAHARAVCRWLDNAILKIDAGRSSPGEGAVRAEASRRALFDRAWNVKLGITDEPQIDIESAGVGKFNCRNSFRERAAQPCATVRSCGY